MMIGLSRAARAKVEAIGQQTQALDCDLYRLTLTSRRPNLKTFNLGKNDDGETFFSAADIIRRVNFLSAKNAAGYDIYITPISNAFHYIVVDDMQRPDAAQRAGYTPSLVLESSRGNWQAILRVPKSNFSGEQSVANSIVKSINADIGDPNFSGVIHPFRLAGFVNKKQGRNNAFVTILHSTPSICTKAWDSLDELREREIKRRAGLKIVDVQAQAPAPTAPALPTAKQQDATGAKAAAVKHYADFAQKFGGNLDLSRVDFAVAQRLSAQRFNANDIQQAIISVSPNILQRHSNAASYAQRTVSAALNASNGVFSRARGARRVFSSSTNF